ncbi:MAG: O-methyltransferase [Streptococcaceae bacterium]|jgi:predicted O-methyltransferase YrrM|nr:O-methyltransferase [Streptococcaceae bacterium]
MLTDVYDNHSNPMMRRPIVKEEVVSFMRNEQEQLTGKLKELQDFAVEHNVPIIPHETIVYFQLMLSLLKPKRILEIGTAIGFSALLFSEICPEAEIVTLERFEEMLKYARPNFEKYDERKQIKLIEGEAAEVLPSLASNEEKFDFIFMDSAKTQYIKFLPYLIDNLSESGLLAIDDVLQAGDIFRPFKETPRRQHNILKALNKLFETVHNDKKLESSLVPLGDGLLLIKCK